MRRPVHWMRKILKALYAYCKKHEAFQPTIFFVSHELETVKSLCKRILVMEHGELIGELSNNPEYFEEENLTYFEKIKGGLTIDTY